ncbi:MAG: polysaccharide deacetylase family protein [Thermoleophilia bacterium]|nr:polysaccharide deacetylase family protein [Thermoleophilia bacterium]
MTFDNLKRPALWSGVALATLGAAYWAPGVAAFSASLRHALGIRDRLDDRRAVALTFDDGPHPEGTPAVLDLLEGAGVEATFFLVGEQVERRPDLARSIAQRGHAVGLHAYRHGALPRFGPWRLEKDTRRAAKVIRSATGVAPRLARPPYGVFTVGDLIMARRHGLRLVYWTRWGRDWEADASGGSIADLASRDLCGGEIILLHDADHYAVPGSWRRTADALPEILERLKRKGLVPVRL